MGIVSYSQNFEDIMLWRALKDIENGFYIDVGAAWHDHHSITKAFYDAGWSGINIEPNPNFIKKYSDYRQRDINLQVAVSDKEGTSEFYFINDTGLSSLNKEIAESHKSIGFTSNASNVNIRTLKSICEEHAKGKDIHFLKVDVEGFEKNVLQSNDWSKIRPWIVVVEATEPMSQIENYSTWEEILINNNYNFAYADGLNRFYVAEEKNELLNKFNYPVNVFDDFTLISQLKAEERANKAEERANKAEERANKAEERIHEIFNHYNAMVNINIRKITKPIRKFKSFIRKKLNIDNYIKKRILKKIDSNINKSTTKRILIDCTFIKTTDLNTGIQRVVRNIVKNIKSNDDLVIETVSLEDGLIYKVDINKKQSNGKVNKLYKKYLKYQKIEDIIIPSINDKLLLLDSTWHLDIWPSVAFAKERGTKVIGVAYDLIPISHPQFCDANLVKLFSEWYHDTLSYLDGYIAISKTVMLDIQQYVKDNGKNLDNYSFDYFSLGSDFKELSHKASDIREKIKKIYKNNKSIYLIVSTIEPRKNHQYLFDTFKELWIKNINATLVIVGRVGWKTEELIKKINEHSEYEKRLFIFNDLDDSELNYCYKNSKALLFPSFVEGYGLPIIESLQNALPVLASDTAIHREVGKEVIDYFDINKIDSLYKKILSIEKGDCYLVRSDAKDIKVLSWKESSAELLYKIDTL